MLFSAAAALVFRLQFVAPLSHILGCSLLLSITGKFAETTSAYGLPYPSPFYPLLWQISTLWDFIDEMQGKNKTKQKCILAFSFYHVLLKTLKVVKYPRRCSGSSPQV